MFGLVKKKELDKPKELATITTIEAVELEQKSTGTKFKFYIGTDDEGRYYALTHNEHKPKFCLAANDFDDAFSLGIDAINYYTMSIAEGS